MSVGNPDPDAQLIMDVLLASPGRDEPGALLAAAKAYEAVRSARDRGAIPPLSNVAYVCPGVDSYGHGLTERVVHAAGCCQRFADLPEVQRVATGLRLPRRYVGEEGINE